MKFKHFKIGVFGYCRSKIGCFLVGSQLNSFFENGKSTGTVPSAFVIWVIWFGQVCFPEDPKLYGRSLLMRERRCSWLWMPKQTALQDWQDGERTLSKQGVQQKSVRKYRLREVNNMFREQLIRNIIEIGGRKQLRDFTDPATPSAADRTGDICVLQADSWRAGKWPPAL